jgi:predicted permease
MTTLWHDIRHAGRMLRRNPGFTAVVVLSLGIAIGANTTIFSAFDQVLLQKLAVRSPEELVIVQRSLARGGVSTDFSHQTFEEFRGRCRSLSGMFAHDGTNTIATLHGEAEIVPTAFVTGSYFSLFGVGAVQGRVFTPDDDRPGAAPVMVLRYDYWKRRFGLDPSIIGRTVDMKGIAFTVIGIAPPSFTGYSILAPADLTMPFVWQSQLSLKDHTTVGIMARLAPGVSRDQAAAELTVLFRDALRNAAGSQLSAQREQLIAAQRIQLASGARGRTGIQQNHSSRVLVLMAAVGLLLLAACANIAGLLLARANARQKEMAIRIAIGAGRWRLIRQMLAESLLLALIGGALGLLIVQWAGDLLPRLLALPIHMQVSQHVLLFTAGISILTGLGFGLIPALRATRLAPLDAMKAGPLGTMEIRFAGKVLVALQVALSISILAGAGLFLKTVRNLDRIDPGFRSEGVLLGWVFPTLAGYEGASELRLYDEILRKCHGLDGVASMSLARHSLMQGNDHESVDAPEQSSESVDASFNAVSSEFFGTMQVPILRGRDFAITDRTESPRVAIVNQSLAERFFARENPIGRRIRLGSEHKPAEIIGVVRDTRWYSLRQTETPLQVFVPYSQAPADELGQMQLIVRVAGEPGRLTQSLRQAIAAIDVHLPLVELTTQTEQVGRSAREERSLARLTTVFGSLALLLAAMGLYGTISYSVSRRTAELGVRMALGASSHGVVRLILRETLALALAGLCVGVPASLAAVRLAKSSCMAWIRLIQPR